METSHSADDKLEAAEVRKTMLHDQFLALKQAAYDLEVLRQTILTFP
jgi:hypothetical protein